MLEAVSAITLVIADDHLLFRATVKEALSREPGFCVVGEAADGLSALKAIVEKKPAVAVLDLAMPGMSGLEVARALRSQGIAAGIVLLTMHNESHIVQNALELGVAGYVLKDHFDAELIAAVRAAALGQRFFSPVLNNSASDTTTV